MVRLADNHLGSNRAKLHNNATAKPQSGQTSETIGAQDGAINTCRLFPTMTPTAEKYSATEQPFGPPEPPVSNRSGSAFVTMLLALYPVVAAIAVVMAGLAVAAPN